MQAFWKRWEPDSYPESGRRIIIQRSGCLFLGYYARYGKWEMGGSHNVTPRLGDLWMYEEEAIKNIPSEQ